MQMYCIWLPSILSQKSEGRQTEAKGVGGGAKSPLPPEINPGKHCMFFQQQVRQLYIQFTPM